jgi:methylaspartate ammonia-lyase
MNREPRSRDDCRCPSRPSGADAPAMAALVIDKVVPGVHERLSIVCNEMQRALALSAAHNR